MYTVRSIRQLHILTGLVGIPFWFVLSLCCFTSYGQEQQSPDRLRDHGKWYTTYHDLLKDGEWITYHKNYPDDMDTLIVQQIENDKKYTLPGCSQATYLGNNLVSVSCEGIIKLIDLNNGNKERLERVTNVQLSTNKRYLLLFKQKENELMVRDLKNRDSMVFYGVYQYLYSDKAQSVSIAISTDKGNELKILYLDGSLKKEMIEHANPRKILEMCWGDKGNNLVYTLGAVKDGDGHSDSGRIGFYDLKRKNLFEFDPSKASNFPELYRLTKNGQTPLRTSPDGERVFFTYSRKEPLKTDDIPEVWKADAPYLHKKMSFHMNWQNTAMIGMWTPGTDRFMPVTSIDYPKAFIDPGGKYALVYDPATYEPQSRWHPPIDLYLMNLVTRERKPFLKKHLNDLNSIRFSPSGRYILYFKNGEWWLYDTTNEFHLNMSGKLNRMLKKPYFYGSSLESDPPGWGRDEKMLFMYNSHDLWSVPVGEGIPERITKGKEESIRYRLILNKKTSGLDANTISFKKGDPLLFSIEKDDRMGYAILEKGKNMHRISFNKAYTRWPNISRDGTMFSFMEETFYMPPRIMVYSTGKRQLKIAFQSNSHYKDYKQGMSKPIQFCNRDGDTLSGVLRFPPDYDKDSIYPMVVRVYQKQRHYLHQYSNPGFNNGTGFNPSNLLAKGYIVFLPDIKYKIGEPGFSAADCIVSGTKEAIKQAAVDPKRIGLIGHSFGGYETLFTITQTDLFATAIASAANASLPRSYLYLDNGINLNFDRFEYGQSRMGKSLFDDYQGYLDNSPLYHAKNINVPLLLWTGKEDNHVFYYQSLSFHLAMKRLGKKNTFLFYPDEGHVFSKPKNQKDITLRVQQWFDHYLKGEPKHEWMP